MAKKKVRIEYKIALLAAAVTLLSVPVSLFNIMGIYSMVGEQELGTGNVTQTDEKLKNVENRQNIVSKVAFVTAGISLVSAGIGATKDVRSKPHKKS